MRLAEPFDTRPPQAVHAPLLGLEIVHAVDPDAVDDNLFAGKPRPSRLPSGDSTSTRIAMTAAELGQTGRRPSGPPGARRRLDTRRHRGRRHWDVRLRLGFRREEIGATAGVSTDGDQPSSATSIGCAPPPSCVTSLRSRPLWA